MGGASVAAVRELGALDGKIVEKVSGHPGYDAEATVNWRRNQIVYTSLGSGDLELWTMKPDGSGNKTRMNCERWGGNSLRWFVYWMQHLPGPGNDLEFQGKRLNSWWIFVADWDRAMENRLKLVCED